MLRMTRPDIVQERASQSCTWINPPPPIRAEELEKVGGLSSTALLASIGNPHLTQPLHPEGRRASFKRAPPRALSHSDQAGHCILQPVSSTGAATLSPGTRLCTVNMSSGLLPLGAC